MRDYGIRDLIRVFAHSQKSSDYQEMREYNTRFYTALSALLNAQLDNLHDDSFRSRILLRHFNITIESYNRQVNPYSGYLEAGLLHKSINELGEKAKRIQDTERVLMDCAQSIVELHLDYLEAMFIGLWGENKTRVSREGLMDQGFDPLDLPEIDF
ncbi:hypothetical protein MF271_22220 (plasmid) [Deinococcus sp. KNUC1210]|uniref:hypothetical protein n=1 Tax=Deinococcus sp. KNUC1210 TaxID=2917691 RepID=UPI001EF06858|nr:hypothetical protein [Deinococcus sp. KNUC1210]ULH18189.1 hypothetical protein MF271_22220 [Deinococcus sp. KNUC1210]